MKKDKKEIFIFMLFLNCTQFIIFVKGVIFYG